MIDEAGDDDGSDFESNQQLMVHSGFEDADDIFSDQTGGLDGDEALPGEEEDDLGVEAADINLDARLLSRGERQKPLPETTTPLKVSRRRSRRLADSKSGLGLQYPAILEIVDENGRPYPERYYNPLLELYSSEDVDAMAASLGKRKRHKKNISQKSRVGSNVTVMGRYPVTEPTDRRESSTSLKSVRFEDDRVPTPQTTILGAEEDDDTGDGDFELPDESDNEVAESDKENAEPKIEHESSSEVCLCLATLIGILVFISYYLTLLASELPLSG